jgi:serine/threonine protein kinase
MKTTLDLYKVGRVIGKGGFGKVNLALHRLTRKLVAIKSIKITQMEDENEKKKLVHEIEILKKLKHESHIKLLETFQTATHICIVLELCPGGDLLSYVRKRRKLSELQAKYIFKQIIQGLHYLESVNIVHRDIKLENILLDGFGRVKIGDFGVSVKIDGPNAVLFEQCGTPAYIAPEIVLEHGYLGLQADVWSSGICLFAMVYGNVPFKITELSQLTRPMLEQAIEYKNTVSSSCIDLMKKVLMLDPKQRLKPLQILKHPWLQDVPLFVDIFDESERDLIRQEFNYGVDAEKP